MIPRKTMVDRLSRAQRSCQADTDGRACRSLGRLRSMSDRDEKGTKKAVSRTVFIRIVVEPDRHDGRVHGARRLGCASSGG
jgi:hypothetical protein